jgi:hypothetical protein
MFLRIPSITLLLAVLAAAVPALARPQVVARVNGEPIHRAEVAYLARVEMGHEDSQALPQNVFQAALKKAITNQALYLKARAEVPDAVREAERAATLAVARDYFVPFLEEIARPAAEARTTIERVLEQVPEKEDLVFLYQITMKDRGELERVREEILAGKISFEDAARRHSEGNTARAGGQVGGIKRGDVRYKPETLALLFDKTPKGGVTHVVDERLAPSLFWVKDRKTAEEIRLEDARTMLPKFVGGDMVAYAWEQVEAYARVHPGTEVLVTPESSQEFVNDPERVALRVAGEAFTARDVFSRSGGMSHSLKDIATIAENCYRDLILQNIYVKEKGALELAAHRKAAMAKHLVGRRMLRIASDDLEVADAEIDQYLAENQAKYALPDRVDLGAIFVKTQERVRQVLERLRVEDFETVARAWSQSKKLASLKGRLGVVPVSQVAGNFAGVEPGTILEPQYVAEGEEPGYYIFKVYRFLPAEPGTRQNLSAEAVGGARSMVMARKKEARLREVVSEAMAGAVVEII